MRHSAFRRTLGGTLLLLALALVISSISRKKNSAPNPSAAPLIASTAPSTQHPLASVGASFAPSGNPSATTTVAPKARTATDKIAAFDAWFLALRRNENPVPALGAELARARRGALKELIATNPKAALAAAVPRSLRKELPAEIQAELETPVDAFGRFEVAMSCFGNEEKIYRSAEIDGRRYIANVFGRRLAALSKNRLPIHGIAIDDQLAIDDAPFRLLEDPETGVDPREARDIRIAVGDERQSFTTAVELDAWRKRAAHAEAAPDPHAILSGPDTAAAPANWTFGEKRVLFIRAEFPDDPGLPVTDAEINATMAEVDQFYRDTSRGRCSMRTTILPGALRLTRNKGDFLNNTFNYTHVWNEAVALARAYDAANGGTGTYHPDRADRFMVVCKSVSSFGFLGIATVGFSGALLNGTVASWVTAHELGHNHGVSHANAWRPTGPSPIGSGTPESYGDPFDVMGNTARLPGAHFNVKHKETLLYLDSDQIVPANTDGVYRLFRHDHRDAAGAQALKIGAGDYEFWLEYRQQPPRPEFPEPTRLRTGVQMRWGRFPANVGTTGTYLLDLTPSTTGTMDDAPMIFGETFRDITAGLSITPIATGGSAPREWIDVRVTYGATGGGNRNPILAASAPTAVVPARTDLTFTGSATDPDGDSTSVRWDFGDGRPLTIGGTVSHRFAKGGPVTVVASAIDGKGGLATKSFDLIIDDPLNEWAPQGGAQGTAFFATVVHDGRQFLAAGSNSLYTSPDGRGWTRRAAIPNLNPQELVVAGSTYVAVGSPSASATAGGIARSTDGLTWATVTPAAPLLALDSVAFGAGRFVSVGRAGTMLHSIDGTIWSALPALTTQDLRAVRFAAGLFAAAGNAGTILTSHDGLVWTNRTFSTGASITFIVHHQGRWITGNGPNVWTSPDTLAWTFGRVESTRPFVTKPISLGPNGLIVPSRDDDRIFASDDGDTWDPIPVVTPTTNSGLRAVATDGDTVVAVATNGRIFQTRTRSATATAPRIATNPPPQFVPVGHGVSLSVGPAAVGTTYQWSKNGEAIPGATRPTLSIAGAQPGDNGSYIVTLTNFSGSTASEPAALAIDPNTARLINLSIRSRAGTGAEVFTVGFVVGRSFYTVNDPTSVKSLLLRGIGPALGGFGVAGALADPRIDFFDGATRIGTNDDWGLGTTGVAALSNTFQQVGAFPLTAGSKDSALLTSFAPKAYTVQLSGANGTTGAALAELYDLDSGITGPRLVNVSARGALTTGGGPLIGGFVLSGGGTRTVLIRAVGPGLTAFGVPGALAQPVISLFRGTEIIATNSGWTAADNIAAIRASAARVGAFALAETSRDSALLETLPTGAYTIQIIGAGGTAGVVLAEVYEVP